MRTHLLLPFLALCAASTGCTSQKSAEAPGAPEAVEVAPPASEQRASAPTGGGAMMDAKMAAAARSANEVREVRLYFDGDGRPRKTAVYHGDASLVPAPVLALVERTYPGASIRFYEYELYEGGEYAHEVELTTEDGEEIEVSAREDGSLRYTERAAPGEPNEGVRATIERLAPGAAIEEVELKQGPGLYELRVKASVPGESRAHYVVFDEEGSVTAHLLRFPAQIEIPAPAPGE